MRTTTAVNEVMSEEQRVYQEVKELISHGLSSTLSRANLIEHLISQLILEKRDEIEMTENALKTCLGELDMLQRIGRHDEEPVQAAKGFSR